MDRRAEVVVIGGGISGCAIAYGLAKRGARVVLLERGEIAGEASGRTWGAVRRQGRQPQEVPLAIESLKLWDRLSEELRSETHFVRGGSLYLAETDEELSQFQASVRVAAEFGLGSDIVTWQRAREIVPGLAGKFVGGMYCPTDGYAHPVKTTHAFARAAQEHGAKILTQTPVERIEAANGRVRGVVTSSGEIKADAVVNAAGVGAPWLAGTCGVRIPIKVVRTYVTVTEPMGDFRSPLVWTPKVAFRPTAEGNILLGAGGLPVDHDVSLGSLRDLSYFRRGFFQYRRQIKLHFGRPLVRDILDRLRVSGSGHRYPAFASGAEPEINWKTIVSMRKAFVDLMPHMRAVRFADTWAGMLDLTPDILPVLGEAPRVGGLFLAAGFSGHGFALGPIVGRLTSELIVDGKSSLPLDDFRLSRFSEGGAQRISRLH